MAFVLFSLQGTIIDYDLMGNILWDLGRWFSKIMRVMSMIFVS